MICFLFAALVVHLINFLYQLILTIRSLVKTVREWRSKNTQVQMAQIPVTQKNNEIEANRDPKKSSNKDPTRLPKVNQEAVRKGGYQEKVREREGLLSPTSKIHKLKMSEFSKNMNSPNADSEEIMRSQDQDIGSPTKLQMKRVPNGEDLEGREDGGQEREAGERQPASRVKVGQRNPDKIGGSPLALSKKNKVRLEKRKGNEPEPFEQSIEVMIGLKKASMRLPKEGGHSIAEKHLNARFTSTKKISDQKAKVRQQMDDVMREKVGPTKGKMKNMRNKGLEDEQDN